MIAMSRYHSSCMWLLARRLQRVIWQKQGVNVAVSSLIGLQHLPHTLMTPQDPYGEMLCFSLYFFIAVCSYHIHPLDGIFSTCDSRMVTWIIKRIVHPFITYHW